MVMFLIRFHVFSILKIMISGNVWNSYVLWSIKISHDIGNRHHEYYVCHSNILICIVHCTMLSVYKETSTLSYIATIINIFRWTYSLQSFLYEWIIFFMPWSTNKFSFSNMPNIRVGLVEQFFNLIGYSSLMINPNSLIYNLIVE